MKRKNPYIWLTIIWAVCTVTWYVLSVAECVDGKSTTSALFCGFAVGFAFTTGGLFAKWREVAEWNKNVRFLEQAHEALDNFIAELEKEKENRPFKEFDNLSDVPFPEVRGDKNGESK